MRPSSKKITKAKNRKISIQKSLFKAKQFSSSSSTSSQTIQSLKSVNEVLDALKNQLAKDGSSWTVEPRDSVEVYKERRRRQKRPNGRVAKKGETKRRRQKTKKKSIKNKKQSCSCGARRLSRKVTRFSTASSETSSGLYSLEN